MKAVISFHMPLNQQGMTEHIKAIMFGKDMQTAYRLLMSKGGFQNSYFRLYETFEHMYFITLDRYGVVLLKLLCDCEKVEKLKRLLSSNLKEGFSVENKKLIKLLYLRASSTDIDIVW